MSNGAWEKLANYMPTGTFLAYQTIASVIVSADGSCNASQKVLAAVSIGLLGLVCGLSAFTDSKSTAGVVNYQFVGQNDLGWADFLHAMLSTTIFATLALFTSPITTCFYPGIPSVIVRAVPTIFAVLGAAIFSVMPPPRPGVGFALRAP